MNNKRPTISIGIPTYETGKSLVLTLQSLYSQTAFRFVKEIIIAVDGKKLPKSIEKQIVNPKLRVVSFPKRKGQSARINDLCRLATTNYLILTNDDILIKKDAIENILNKLVNKPVDLISCKVDVVSNKSFIEKVINIGKEINIKIATSWNKGNNFLHCNGRLIVLSKRLYKTLSIPELLWNNDAYIYLFNKISKGSFAYLPSATGFYQAPRTLSEHFKQSSKFQLSLIENQQYFSKNLKQFYTPSIKHVLPALSTQFIQTPLLFAAYLAIYGYTRILNRIVKPTLPTRGFWDTDKSTKQISLNGILL